MGKKQLGLFTLLFLIASTIADAQQPVKVHKIGLLLSFSGLLPSSIEAFRQGCESLATLKDRTLRLNTAR